MASKRLSLVLNILLITVTTVGTIYYILNNASSEKVINSEEFERAPVWAEIPLCDIKQLGFYTGANLQNVEPLELRFSINPEDKTWLVQEMPVGTPMQLRFASCQDSSHVRLVFGVSQSEGEVELSFDDATRILQLTDSDYLYQHTYIEIALTTFQVLSTDHRYAQDVMNQWGIPANFAILNETVLGREIVVCIPADVTVNLPFLDIERMVALKDGSPFFKGQAWYCGAYAPRFDLILAYGQIGSDGSIENVTPVKASKALGRELFTKLRQFMAVDHAEWY
jgi:hypothetical protein